MTTAATKKKSSLSLDFWTFLGGQMISNLGSSITMFAVPLLTYKLTGSAVYLSLASVATFLPYLLFGLIIGAWVDRVDRKRLMIRVDLLQAALIMTIPLVDALGMLSIWWIIGVGFVSSTLTSAFQAAEFAAIPSLVQQDDLITANGRIEASYAAVIVVGPLLAGMLVAFLPLSQLMLFDALSFIVSVATLALIKTGFNAAARSQRSSIQRDIVDGLRYVLGHPVLRNIALMMALVNFFSSTIATQLVFFAHRRLDASDTQIGWMYSAGSVGALVLALLAGPLRKRWSFSQVALGSMMLNGLLLTVMAYTRSIPIGIVLWALASGMNVLFIINSGSLRQAIVPNELLGRVMTIAGVLAWSTIPLGTILGGLAIEYSGDVALVFAIIGALTVLIPAVFTFTALGRADQYLPRQVDDGPAMRAEAVEGAATWLLEQPACRPE
jgi:MFS family permease